MGTAFLVLLGYCVAVFAASMLGGRISALGALTHTRTQVVMSLVAGLILGMALYHLLPHGLERISGPGNIEKGALWCLLGVVLMVGLQRMFQFHQHDFSNEAKALRSDHPQSGKALRVGGVAGVIFGLAVHTIIEGVALGASTQASIQHDGGIKALPGLDAFLAILLHKPLDAYSIMFVVRLAGWSRGACNRVNLGYALLCPLAALASFWVGSQLGAAAGGELAGYVLCFAAGTFLCVALSDLLPEIHFHTHDRLKLIVAFLVGVAFAYALHLVEAGTAHHHHHH